MAYVNIQAVLNNLGQYVSYVPDNQIPIELNGKIVPILDITPLPNPIDNVAVSVNVTSNQNSGLQSTIYTTPTDTDFYLTSFMVGYSSNAVNTDLTFQATVNGQIVTFFSGYLNAVFTTGIIKLSNPIKLDRNTAITFTHNYYSGGPAGLTSATATITGFDINLNQTGLTTANY